MTVAVPGGTLRLNVRRATAISWAQPIDPPYGDLGCQILIDGVRRRFFDRTTLYREAASLASTSSRPYVMRLTIDDDFDAKWETVANLNTADAFNDLLVSAGIYENAASSPGVDDICPTASLNRSSDKVLDVTFTPQVSGHEDAVESSAGEPYVAPTITTSHMVKMDGSALLTSELPVYGAVPAMASGNVITAGGGAAQLLADSNGEYKATVDGVADVVLASGYSQFDVVGVLLTVTFSLSLDRFRQFNAVVSGAANGERLIAEVDSGSVLGDRTHDGVGGFFGFIDDFVASGVTLDYVGASGSILLNAEILDGGATASVVFDPGYSPGPSRFTWTSTLFPTPTFSTPLRANPYSTPYDSDIRYGFHWADAPTAKVYGPDGALIATNADLESNIPAHASPTDYTEIETGKGVYMGYVSSTEIQGAINVIVMDDTLSTGDNIHVELDLTHALL